MQLRINISILLLAALFSGASAGIFGSLFHRDPSWNTLRVTWGLNVARDHIFMKMPLKTKKADDKGYVKIQPGAGCSGKFLGHRYAKPDNPSLVTLYDHNGYFAGIQTRFLKKNETIEAFHDNSYFIEEEVDGTAYYTLTAYLVDPDIICTTGRTEKDYDDQEAGTALYIQDGSNPLKNYIKLPYYENETQAAHWVRGSCFPSMGVHYWYNTSKEMQCKDLKPIFLVFNAGKLTGFGWAVQDKIAESKNFELPDKDNLDRFFSDTPRCIKDIYKNNSGLTMMHIYMNAKPWNLIC